MGGDVTSLSIIVPTRNPHYSFVEKSIRLACSNPTWQIILIDDSSTIALESCLLTTPNLEVYRNNLCLGAGACRNIGLTKIKRDYTIFIDDDDEMHWDVVARALTRMEAEPSIDVSFFLYERLLNGIHQPALESDHMIINKILQGNKECIVSLHGNEMLLAFTNYPWNKVYRSSFLIDCCLRFSETPVQNDILAHWQTLIRAQKICLSDELVCTKTDYDNAERIGNTQDSKSVTAFQALHETYQFIRLEGTQRTREVFVKFYLNLVCWLTSKCSLDTRALIFKEHLAFVEMMQSDDLFEGVHSEVVGWEFWNMPILGEDTSMRTTSNPCEVADAPIVLAEMSRLKRLAAAFRTNNEALTGERYHLRSENEALTGERDHLRSENEALRGELNQLRLKHQELHSKLTSQMEAYTSQSAEIDFFRQLSSRRIVKFAVRAGDCFYRLSHWNKKT